MTSQADPPRPAAVAPLRPLRSIGLLHVGGSVVTLCGGLAAATLGGRTVYWIAQLALAFAFLHAFVLLHEAGHRTLFRSRRANRLVGDWAGFVALIPFDAWHPIHARHHRYTGWQDLDATTASLVPRPIARWERAAVDVAWRAWLPLFSILYRLQNYWNLPRIRPFLADPVVASRIRTSIVAHLAGYAALAALVGPAELLVLVGPALLLSLMAQDLLILSQHTHVPQQLSGGRRVRPFPPFEQVRYTRSLRLPAWLSTSVLHFDAHELHHMYPNVPGYLLHRIDYQPPNTMHWLDWIRAAKRLSGTTFLFSNRDRTGAPI